MLDFIESGWIPLGVEALTTTMFLPLTGNVERRVCDGDAVDTNKELRRTLEGNDADVGVEVKSEPMDCSESLNRLSPTIGRIVLPDDNVGAMTFVDDAVKQLGFKTEMEEVQPGVFYPLAQKCLFVVKTLEKSF